MSQSNRPRPGTVVNYEVTGNGTPDSPAAILFSVYSGNDPGIAAIRAVLPEGTRLEAQPLRVGGGYALTATNKGTSRNDLILLWLRLADALNWRLGSIR